jgi:hypothetical protein
MEMRRRQALAWGAAALAAALVPLARRAPRVEPLRAWLAARAARYPGPVRPLECAAVRRPGRWAG